MKRRLTIEEHNVAVDQMTVNHVALPNIDRIGIHISQAQCAVIYLEIHRLGSRMLIRTILDVAHQTIAVVRTDNLREGQIHSNLLRNTKLIQLNVSIGCDNRTCREVHTLSHQVTTHTSCLGSKAGLQSAQGTTRTLCRRLQTLDVIVNVRSHVILKSSRVLIQGHRRLLLIDLVAQAVI